MESSDLNNGQGTMDEFYSSNNSVDYPNVEIKRLPTNNLVYQLKNTTEGLIKFQDFRYNGFVVNMNGLGSVGFNKTARSTWYQSPSAKRIWNVTENNPLQRGATLRSYSQLVDNGQSFSFVASGNPAGIINSTTNVFAANTTYSIYSLLLNNQTITDYMTNVSTVITNTYDTTYLLPLTTITQNLLNGLVQGTSTVTNEFDNNPTGIGTAYYIGRPKKSTSVATAYGDTFSTEQKYAYLNNNLSRLEKKGNTANAIYITEDYEYDVYGNLKKKTLSMPGATPILTPRITEYTYDPTGRFVKTAKDVEGLVSTNDTYHPLYGLVTSSTNPLGLTTTSIYDNWGKPTQITDFLGKSIYYSYSKTANEYTTTKTGDDGSSSIAISDALGRPKKSGVKNIDATWSYKNVEYDFLGRKYRESEPYNSGSPTLWNTSTFDDYNRIITSVTATGLTTNVTYSGLTVTGNDGTKTTSSTKNANGHVVSATDNGGTINYTYYANGNLKTSDYQGTVISMEYNEWGNKTKLTDPSAGIYTYSYYPTGESFEETTPNGKTSFYYDSVGKTIKKTIVGTNTNSETIYLYDNITKMPTTSTFKDIVNGNAITTMTFEYDTYKRLYKTTEVTPFASFTKQLTFDAFGRVEKETSTAAIGTTTSAKTIKNTYLNGYPWQILDDTGQQVLWQTNTVNARGQLTSANQGRETITNTYDQYGFATQFKHDWSFHGVSGNVMTLNTVFDPLKGNLSSRTNSMFGTTDNFAYDSLDRLTTYPNALGVLETQTYDDRGRITKNNLGDYNYTNTAKAYQNTSVTIGPEADGYYSNREGIFNDSMESQSGWDNTGLDAWAVANQATISYDATSVHSGKYALKLSNATASVKVIHTNKEILIDNATDTQYTYSAWVKSDNPSVNLFLFMKTQTETGYYTTVDNVNTTVKNQWVKIEKTVLVPASIKKLSLRLDNNGSGNVWYDDVKIRKTSNPATDIRQLNITYNTFKSPVEIGETGVDKVSFTYNDGNDRSTMFYGGLGLKETRQYRKHYSADGSMEIKQNMSTGAIEFVTYIGGDGYTAPIVLKSDGTTQKYLYLHRDYQGSILAITDATGAVVEKRLFDAWGNIVKVQDGAGNNLNVLTILDRGYTGHEHLQSVGLIHMNGRLYDPKLHRFLQPDNNIQDPYNTQNYNRYGYVLNNPLKYTDPSGEVIGIGVAVLIGAVIAATTYTMTALLADVPFTVGGLVGASFIGAFSAAVTFGIGSVATGIQQLGARMVFQALAHGMFNGMMSGVQGGNFWSGFAAGSLSSIAAGLWQGGAMATGDGNWSGLGGNFGNTDFGTIAFGTISGGAGAALTGGNFWQGAVTGLMVSALNEVAHKNSERRSFRSRFHNVDPDAEPTQSMNSVNAVIDDVDDLSEFYNSNDVDAPKINLIKNDGDAGHYYPKNDSNISKRHTIELTKNAFKSNYHLARTIFHESYHSLQYNWNGGAVIRGITAKYGRIYKNDLTGIESRGMMVLERQAYSFVWQLGDSDMYTIGEINRRKF
jgi:RHS repeat-associated protein